MEFREGVPAQTPMLIPNYLKRLQASLSRSPSSMRIWTINLMRELVLQEYSRAVAEVNPDQIFTEEFLWAMRDLPAYHLEIDNWSKVLDLANSLPDELVMSRWAKPFL